MTFFTITEWALKRLVLAIQVQEYGEEKASSSSRSINESLFASLAGGFTGSDGQTFRDSMLDALDAIDVAANLQADCLVVLAGSRGGHTKKHARRCCGWRWRNSVKPPSPGGCNWR